MYQPPDGRPRSLTDERRLNEAFAALFTGGSGELVLNYLKHISINAVAGPGIDPNSLLHLEGQRYIVGLIETRVKLGQKNEPSEDANERKRRTQTGRKRER